MGLVESLLTSNNCGLDYHGKQHTRCKKGSKGCPGAQGPMGTDGPSLPGEAGAQGPAGVPGPMGSNSTAGALVSAQSFSATDGTQQSYITPVGARSLHVLLWGAGGGGGGATTTVSPNENLAMGGGGGGGGFAEAILLEPLQPTYSFLLAPGGTGGLGTTGNGAAQSWFSSPSEMFADGGGGGATGMTTTSSNPVMGAGGAGGLSGGTLTIVQGSGSWGTDAYGGPFPIGYIFGGIGGAAGHASGNTLQQTWGYEGPPVSVSGISGQTYGGGGGGAVIGNLGSQVQAGGNGAGAYLMISAFS